MLKFLKREIVTLKISDNKIEIVSDKKEVTSIKREFISLGEDLDKEEVSEINIKKYIEQEILEIFFL